MSKQSRLRNEKRPNSNTRISRILRQREHYEPAQHLKREQPKPAWVKLGRRLKSANLKTLLVWEARLAKSVVFLCRAFTKWRAEVPSILADHEWPDRPGLVVAARCYDVVATLIAVRRPEFEAKQFVLPVPLEVTPSIELPRADLAEKGVIRHVKKFIAGLFGVKDRKPVKKVLLSPTEMKTASKYGNS